MARSIPRDRALTAEDRAYLHSRGLHAEVERLDEMYGSAEEEDLLETDDDPNERMPYSDWGYADLQEEIKLRNAGDYRAPEHVMSATGKKDDLVSRLEEDDARYPQAADLSYAESAG